LAAIVSNAVTRDAAKSQSTLLIHEMKHRAANLLQLVNSIASQTFRDCVDLPEARASFSQRLSSLGRTNQAILREGWSSTTRFRMVAEETLAPFTGRIEMIGRDILLPSDLSFDLGLVLNELATNSCKYGSLGSEEGLVSLTWKIASLSDPEFQAEWRDPITRGEPATDTTSTGFGSKLIQQVIERKWKGTVDVRQGDGYHMCFTVPI
jgi:two-component sensor histidine kinase